MTRSLPSIHLGTLDSLPLGQTFVVTSIRTDAEVPDRAQALDELGFTAGERVQLLARGPFGGDPLVVRVGTSTYALRRAEAACVRVLPA